MESPYFPLQLRDTPSVKRFVDIGEETHEVEDLRITAAMVHHPQGAAGYRLERNGRSVAFIPDSELGDDRSRASVTRLAEGVDVLIHDAQYTPEEYDQRYKSWGHSSWMHVVETAQAAGVKSLILFHHDPDRTDAQLDAIREQVREAFPGADVAREGMTISL